MLLSYLDAKSRNVCHIVRFDAATLFFFDMALNFLTSLLAAPYIPCFVALHRHTHGSEKGGTLLYSNGGCNS